MTHIQFDLEIVRPIGFHREIPRESKLLMIQD